MIYCDSSFQNSDSIAIHPVFRGRKSAHLMADTTEELINYAISIGLDECWIQHKGRITEHFDVVGIKLSKVLKDNKVIKLNRNEFVKKYQEKLDRRNDANSNKNSDKSSS